ncbi:MAG TPA: hypothetical protein DIW67_17475 [Pseudomonas sp.]|uniref:hypothetical protein n=1 Tax=Pseudomonas sp. TaxID=306 RepID=UPI000ED9C520|nr:hypothetical protein [Pseudomonas sp.]HCS08893.1 hypothetical protein [Pseudomonas sp.]
MKSEKGTTVDEKDFKKKAHYTPPSTTTLPAPQVPESDASVLHYSGGEGYYAVHIGTSALVANATLELIVQLYRQQNNGGNTWFYEHTVTAEEAIAQKAVINIHRAILNPNNNETVTLSYEVSGQTSSGVTFTLAE